MPIAFNLWCMDHFSDAGTPRRAVHASTLDQSASLIAVMYVSQPAGKQRVRTLFSLAHSPPLAHQQIASGLERISRRCEIRWVRRMHILGAILFCYRKRARQRGSKGAWARSLVSTASTVDIPLPVKVLMGIIRLGMVADRALGTCR